MDIIDTYINNHQKTIAQYIATSPILKLFLLVERRPGSQIPKWWWEQEGLDWDSVW